MKRLASSFGSLLGLWFLAWVIASPVCGEDSETFSVSGPLSEKGQATTIAELKQQAVGTFLKSRLGPYFKEVEKEVTPTFAEEFILDYQVGKSLAGANQLALSGHLDAKGLMRWVRLKQTKTHGGSTVKPILIISANLPGLTLAAKETNRRIQDSQLAKTLRDMAVQTLQPFSVNLTTAPDYRIQLTEPPRREMEIRQLYEFGALNNINGLLWLHVDNCLSCGGAKLLVYFYNLAQSRLAIENAHNLSLSQSQYSNGQALRAVLAKPFEQLQSAFEEIVSSGTLYSRVYELLIEEIGSYRGFRQVSEQITKPDFITRALLKRIEPGKALFEVLSPLAPSDFSQQIGQASFGGFRLQPIRVTSNGVVVRYLGQ